MSIEIQTVTSDDLKMNYIRFGQGTKPLVILPGLSLKRVLLMAGLVAMSYQDFTDDYDIYLFERREEMPEVYTVEEMARDTSAVMKSLGIEKACLFGVSHGGMAAQMLTIMYPELVERLILASTSSRLGDNFEEIASLWIRLAIKGEIRELVNQFASRVYSRTFYEKNVETIIQSSIDADLEDRKRFVAQIRGISGFSAYEKLGQISCPVLVIGAAEDQIVGPQASRDIAEKIGCDCYIYEGYGHAVYDEAPDYHKRMRAFFEAEK